MNTFIGVAAFGLSLCSTGCWAGPPPTQAPTGFDNVSNGVADDATHQADQAKFEEFEAIADGLGPLFNAQSCRECHQNPVSGGGSQVLELRVGHKGPDGRFQNADQDHGCGISPRRHANRCCVSRAASRLVSALLKTKETQRSSRIAANVR